MTERDKTSKPTHRVLLLPGWQNSGAGHWQSRWELRFSDTRVDQDDWQWPKRGDWLAQLEHAVLADPRPALLAAHSLGCHLVSAWAAHSQHAARVAGALLVAPPDLDRDDLPPQLAPWRSTVRRALPFPATVVWSDNDPYCAPARAEAMAAAWGASQVAAGPRGHLNGDSGLGDWPEGRELLNNLTGGC
jgi:predicted alpha/beta hydrolase family esterase